MQLGLTLFTSVFKMEPETYSCCSSCTSRHPAPPNCEQRSNFQYSGTFSASSHARTSRRDAVTGCSKLKNTRQQIKNLLFQGVKWSQVDSVCERERGGEVFKGVTVRQNSHHIVVDRSARKEVVERQPTSSSQTILPAGPDAPSSSCRDIELTLT